MFKEFKTFIIRGNVIDLAVGLIIGAAFGKIVTSFVTDVLTPPLGKLMGRIDFSQLVIDLSGQGIDMLEQAKATGAPVIRYGLFFNVLLDFIITGFAVFCLVKAINRLKEKPQAAAEDPKTKDCPYCLTTIPLKATRCGHCTSQLTPG